MKYKITGKVDLTKDQWLPVMVCPKCGYETTVTNICRSCSEMPATEEMRRPIYCSTHKMYHRDKDGKPMSHKSIAMVYSGRICRFGGEEEKEFQPKENEMSDIWIGRAVEFIKEGEQTE